ncbi:D-arabinono-1,4-lactone oxidase [Flindersiella endophytica]
MNAAKWRNWAGTASASPRRVELPYDSDEVSELVAGAVREGLRVKAVGSGHSFTPIAVTDGVLLRLDNLTGLHHVDAEAGLVTFGAGTPLHEVNRLLDGAGLAMRNLGDIDRQTLAGAISTGTHGTGLTFGGLATQVSALQLVTADGTQVYCSESERPDLFAAARLGLGAIGVLTAVTLRCEPAFALRAVEGPMPLPDVLAGLDELVEGNEHFEFYWFPYTDRTSTKQNNRVPGGTPLRPVGRISGWIDDELLSNGVFGAVNRLLAIAPKLAPVANRVASRALSAREFVDRSHRVFVSPRRVVFREMEYAIPRAALPDVLKEIEDWIDHSSERIAFPIEVRFAAADDLWLSTAHGRESAYVAVHQYEKLPYEPYFEAVEQIASAVGGRPHWGKLHHRTADDLRELYPRFGDFLRVRDETDPSRVFSNAYLDRVLG